ncbi:DUF3467 domain-containing protein [Patescibacteria group bacterium]|nr:DUF3467 domain-containing protein [Patescibacteria group bacterium]MBP9710232.1 DUF3467 domain-containing protein [Patescibacteria group bacterium]
MDENKNPSQSIEIIASPEELRGAYANIAGVTVQERDVVIDFANTINFGGKRNTNLVSRLFLNHFTAREVAEAIQTGLRQWEDIRFENPKRYS